ncbi:hypothetical protein DYU11_20270 [Fibrisoma montanum]|uniref:Uncharacterized protein n=1 Tax=Fibrisoma montanum TaxID=2305895 RepID=A0A418M3U9_9BACT|nr:hypothetical protein [Fibrisoma montanum]RIV20389.1 hypothetical protein DYU11_20270 [Fibrisoma montanum]
MENTNRAYDAATIDLLYGQVKDTRYTTEVCGVLTERGFSYDDGYIRWLMAHRHKVYNEVIWDAVKEVIKRRKERRLKNAKEVLELVKD